MKVVGIDDPEICLISSSELELACSMAEVYIEEAGLFSSGAAYGQQHEPRQILAVACS